MYLGHLESLHASAEMTVSSRRLGEQLKMNDTQVRKDFATFGAFGQPGVGYEVQDLIRRIRRALGVDRPWNVVLIGVGNLGRALLSHGGFEARSLKIVAVFDTDPNRIGKNVRGHVIQPMDALEAAATSQDAKLALLAVPGDAAQEATDHLVRAGIRGILNFTAATLHAPGIAVQQVDLSAELEQLAFRINAAAFARDEASR